MKVTVHLDDHLLKPLIDEHLEGGRSVGSLVADAVSLRNKVREAIKGRDNFAAFVGLKSSSSGNVYDAVEVWPHPGYKEEGGE